VASFAARDMSDPRLLRGHDIVCFSSIDWHFIWQGHQEIMSTLAANGNRILFIENTGVRAASVRDLPRLRERLGNWWRGTKGFRHERDNLFVFSPVLLPFPYSRLVRRFNRVLLLRAVRRWMGAAGFDRPIVWTFLPTPLIREAIAGLEPLVSVYYCIDDFVSSSPAARHVEASERQLFRDVDLVFVTAEKLRARAAQFNTRVYLFPFGVSLQKFEAERRSNAAVPADLAAIRRPVVGYVGGVHRWIDFPLIAEAARRMPEVSFVLVGPAQADTSALHGLSNVHLLGTRDHNDVPKYIKGFDVGIVPYLLTDYTANVYPTKLNEYLAMGIPVVTTDLPEIRRFNQTHGETVAIAGDVEAFVEAIGAALGDASMAARQRRTEVAAENSWQTRIALMSELIRERLEIARERRPWEVRLRSIYRRARGRMAAATVTAVLVYLAIFQSSIPWLLAEPLRVSDEPRPADVIVVFAGGVGESGQAGGGYQERVKRAVDLYQAEMAPHMIFQSGYIFAFAEAEIMRGLAVSVGVPPSDITLETTGINTYEAVTRVHDLLRQRGWRRILLVSSPYNMRRATMVWRKQAPDIEVVAAPVTDTQFYAHYTGASLEQLRGLSHEVIAIVWYWWKGWL
jgi:uncharacterized SAM-binding protein YcdF (DUF218 family)/glycosyltransferase involved in cell wall biosynthesis